MSPAALKPTGGPRNNPITTNFKQTKHCENQLIGHVNDETVRNIGVDKVLTLGRGLREHLSSRHLRHFIEERLKQSTPRPPKSHALILSLWM